jgi:hypothetical protein
MAIRLTAVAVPFFEYASSMEQCLELDQAVSLATADLSILVKQKLTAYF